MLADRVGMEREVAVYLSAKAWLRAPDYLLALVYCLSVSAPAPQDAASMTDVRDGSVIVGYGRVYRMLYIRNNPPSARETGSLRRTRGLTSTRVPSARAALVRGTVTPR